MSQKTSELERQALTFRKALLEHDRDVARTMAVHYTNVKAAIEVELAQIVSKISEAKAAGLSISTNWLIQQDRYQALLAQTQRSLNEFAQTAGTLTNQSSQIAAHMGTDHAKALVQTGIGDLSEIGGTVSLKSLPQEALGELIAQVQPGTPVGDVLARYGVQGQEVVRSELIEGMALGKNPLDIAAAIQHQLGGALTSALLVARNETMRAYRSAALETYRENDHIVGQWRWVAGLGPHTCAVCIGEHGTLHPLTESFASHVGCRCSAVPVTKSWEELGFNVPKSKQVTWTGETGVAWFARQPSEVQKKILGSGKLAAYQDGKLTLPDLVGKTRDPIWGTGRREKTLKELGLPRFSPPTGSGTTGASKTRTLSNTQRIQNHVRYPQATSVANLSDESARQIAEGLERNM